MASGKVKIRRTAQAAAKLFMVKYLWVVEKGEITLRKGVRKGKDQFCDRCVKPVVH